jgi:hypothetical protein
VSEQNKTTKANLLEMIAQLEDLKKQATLERSHFYVAATATRAIEIMYEILGERYAER